MPYVYCSKSYKWLANAFWKGKNGKFQVDQCREVQKLICIYHKCAEMQVNKGTEEQILKDIARTFPNNDYFDRQNSGFYSMFKVLCAYSNLDEMINAYQSSPKYSSDESQESSSTGIISTSDFKSRSEFRGTRNSNLRNELIDSFCELSFEDSTQYVQGMNFIGMTYLNIYSGYALIPSQSRISFLSILQINERI